VQGEVGLQKLTKAFDDVVAVDAVSLDVRAGEFVTLLGPSGCGKTTTLRMIAGFVEPDSGEIRIGIVAGRDASANFDMQSLTSLQHGDQIRVRRSAHRVRFVHPRGWSYYTTLRRKLRWYEGVV
jgi:ABC-type Na+ transport system ATPase subunit NatA